MMKKVIVEVRKGMVSAVYTDAAVDEIDVEILDYDGVDMGECELGIERMQHEIKDMIQIY